jgi:hypothetical protein
VDVGDVTLVDDDEQATPMRAIAAIAPPAVRPRARPEVALRRVLGPGHREWLPEPTLGLARIAT